MTDTSGWGPDNRRVRLEIVNALLAAFERATEVHAALSAAADEQGAALAVDRILKCGETPARAVVEMRWLMMTRSEQARLRDERVVLLASLDDVS